MKNLNHCAEEKTPKSTVIHYDSIYEFLEEAKLIYGDKNQYCVFMGRQGAQKVTGKGASL